ncbi:hypothetical protein RIF29_31098 [Crotalaria pallida]|uniref:Protein kinase domain-containing protein n=1 Tax=Crotalaria pallida TaxID=3830 RepID=A0AAN9EHL6_CROPI
MTIPHGNNALTKTEVPQSSLMPCPASLRGQPGEHVGEYSKKVDHRGYPQVIKWKGSAIKKRVGPWNGLHFTGYPVSIPRALVTFEVVVNQKEVYYEYQLLDRSIYSIIRLTPSGSGQRLSWESQTRSLLEVFARGEQDPCDNYALCGSNSICNMNGNVPTWDDDLYVRVPASELDYATANGHGNKKKLVGITVAVMTFALTICACILIKKKRGVARIIYRKHYENILKTEEVYLPTFDLAIIAKATDNFSSSNKLGEGGFGPVYKGTLADGKELAVKRLSENSVQGLEEFQN